VTVAPSIKDVCKTLCKAAKMVIDWGVRNGVQFDLKKIEVAFFIR
jgi:hypothetical protein